MAGTKTDGSSLGICLGKTDRGFGFVFPVWCNDEIINVLVENYNLTLSAGDAIVDIKTIVGGEYLMGEDIKAKVLDIQKLVEYYGGWVLL